MGHLTWWDNTIDRYLSQFAENWALFHTLGVKI